jgi:carnitine monooxygenase subunit
MNLSNSTRFYSDPSLFALEQERIFNTSPLMLCHESEIPSSGDYLTFNIAGEPIVVLRTEENKVAAFFNICIHRGFPIFTKHKGQMGDHIRCGYHGWKYNRDGKLINEIGNNCSTQSLKPIRVSKHFGFIFVNLGDSRQDPPDLFQDWYNELGSYYLENLRPVRQEVFEKVLDINWKFFIENTLEGHHVPTVHPGLDDLIGADYQLEFRDFISKTVAPLKSTPQRFWSERMYSSLIKNSQNTNESQRQKWLFYFVFPNVQISIYPEQIFHLQAIPISVDKTYIRGRFLKWPDDTSRATRLAEYLNLRIGRKVYREDLAILAKISGSFTSKKFKGLALEPEKDRVLQHFHDCHARAIKE